MYIERKRENKRKSTMLKRNKLFLLAHVSLFGVIGIRNPAKEKNSIN